MYGKWIAGTTGIGLLVAAAVVAQDGKPEGRSHDGAEADAVRSMSHMDQSANPHLKLTVLRPPNEADRKQAEQMAKQLRALLKKYKDYRVAEQDGYHPFLAHLDLPEYHFTNVRYGFMGALWFVPSKPTSLLYRKTSKGYELLGAMYTASRFATENDLHSRIPLSVARWHAHVNICLPPRAQYPAADWSRFGFTGSIATEEACAEAGGKFHPQIFGWMVHVYPFEKSPEKIWRH